MTISPRVYHELANYGRVFLNTRDQLHQDIIKTLSGICLIKDYGRGRSKYERLFKSTALCTSLSRKLPQDSTRMSLRSRMPKRAEQI